jgi:hypothetical protein
VSSFTTLGGLDIFFDPLVILLTLRANTIIETLQKIIGPQGNLFTPLHAWQVHGQVMILLSLANFVGEN